MKVIIKPKANHQWDVMVRCEHVKSTHYYQFPSVVITLKLSDQRWPKELLIEFWEISRSYSGYKINPGFSKVPFSTYF